MWHNGQVGFHASVELEALSEGRCFAQMCRLGMSVLLTCYRDRVTLYITFTNEFSVSGTCSKPSCPGLSQTCRMGCMCRMPIEDIPFGTNVAV